MQSEFPTIAGALSAMAEGRLEPATVLDACLARIAALNGTLHAVHHLDAAGARATRDAGPLAGIPWGIKDNFDVAGLPCTANSRLRAGRMAPQDAPIVSMLRQTGAPLIGKLATWEYGTGTGAEHFDLPRLGRTPPVPCACPPPPLAAAAC